MRKISLKRNSLLTSIYFTICSFIVGCNTNTETANSYSGGEWRSLNELVNREVKNGVKNDSLIIGLRLGMTTQQVDSVFKKAVKDSLITHSKNGFQYTITRFDDLGEPHKYISTIETIHDDLTSKLIGVDLLFLDGDSKGLMFLFNEKYGEVKYHSQENNDVRDIYLSKGKVIEFKTYQIGELYHVTYTDIDYVKEELETIEEEKKSKMEKQLQEKEKLEKSGKAGTKTI